ncbi:RidA family protein [Nonomuraea ferruginea]|uniref:Atu1372/SO_1960 family protein n=1 Tax=Nonomuraea ferruginea TaxID=46174 RepID=A0ABT4SQI1_9ACTN|nr:Atu1372/SO_1960 family protein [Nonomuraea ferruginea]MDA0639489.1 Atu1372/SO_1960 family protein [Nonomuraea ferruginea]
MSETDRRTDGAIPEELPEVPCPRGAYAAAVSQPHPLCPGRGYVPCSALVVSAGMTPRRDGTLTVTGLVGGEVDTAAAAEAAGLAARNALAAVADAAGGLDRLHGLLRLSVFIACVDGFTELSAVADGASAALARTAPALGIPARTAVGVRALPGGAPVEIELTAAAQHPPTTQNAAPDTPITEDTAPAAPIPRDAAPDTSIAQDTAPAAPITQHTAPDTPTAQDTAPTALIPQNATPDALSRRVPERVRR